jgi:hypothetical protein
MKKGLKVFLSVSTILILLIYFFSRPVFLRLKDFNLIVFNPFRNRSAEQSAEDFLRLIKEGQCAEAMKFFPMSRTPSVTCEFEKQAPLTTWRLIDREDESQQIILGYKYNCQNCVGEPILFVCVEKHTNRVINYERIY